MKKCHFRRVVIEVPFVNITAYQIQKNKQENTSQSEKKWETSNYVNSFIYHYHPLHSRIQNKTYLFIVNFHWIKYNHTDFIRNQYFKRFSEYFQYSFDVILVGPKHDEENKVYGNTLRENGYYSYYSVPFTYDLVCKKQKCNYDGFFLMNDDSYVDAQNLNQYNLSISYHEPSSPFIPDRKKWGWPWAKNPLKKTFLEGYNDAIQELMNSPFNQTCNLYDQQFRRKGYSDFLYLTKDDIEIYNQVAIAMFKHRVFLEMASPTAFACVGNTFFLDCNYSGKNYPMCVHQHPVKYSKNGNKNYAMNRLKHK